MCVEPNFVLKLVKKIIADWLLPEKTGVTLCTTGDSHCTKRVEQIINSSHSCCSVHFSYRNLWFGKKHWNKLPAKMFPNSITLP